MNVKQSEQQEAPFGNATCEQGHCDSFPAHHSTSGQRTPPHRGQEQLCLSCGRVLPLLWEGFSFEKLKTLFRNVNASFQSKVEKQSAKSQTGKPRGAEWDELGRLQPNPALQIPGGI